VTLRLDGSRRIAEVAHETSACVLAQASASLLGAHLEGADEAIVRKLRADVGAMLRDGEAPAPPFSGYAALSGAAPYRNRHTCVLLPVDAVLDALGKV
jgi:NifU-like protein involved in Fe-S cluster formation